MQLNHRPNSRSAREQTRTERMHLESSYSRPPLLFASLAKDCQVTTIRFQKPGRSIAEMWFSHSMTGNQRTSTIENSNAPHRFGRPLSPCTFTSEAKNRRQRRMLRVSSLFSSNDVNDAS